jgi:hypothetical protein
MQVKPPSRKIVPDIKAKKKKKKKKKKKLMGN